MTLDSRSFLTELVSRAPAAAIFVSSLGRTSGVLFDLRPDETLFLDSMGDVSAVAIGIAVGAPSVPVVAIDTDGSFLMNLSVLPVLGAVMASLGNFGLAIVDNGIYESAGGLPSRRCRLDWSGLFGAVGLAVIEVSEADEVPRPLVEPGRVVVALVHDSEPPPPATKPLDGIESAYRVEAALRARQSRPRRIPARKA